MAENDSGKAYYYRQVDFYLQRGHLALALHQANKNIAYNEQDPLAYINRARVYEKLDRIADAVADLEEALRLEPRNEPALSRLEKLSRK